MGGEAGKGREGHEDHLGLEDLKLEELRSQPGPDLASRILMESHR